MGQSPAFAVLPSVVGCERLGFKGVSVGKADAIVILELLSGFEPETSSLPRKCSTPELQQRVPEEEPPQPWSG